MSLESVRKRLEAAWAHPYMVAASSPGPKVCAACGRDTSERCDAAGESADLIAHAPTDLELMANVVEAAIERDAAQYERNDTPIDIVPTQGASSRAYWAEVDRRTARCDAAETAYRAALDVFEAAP